LFRIGNTLFPFEEWRITTMADRKVTATGKASDGDITSLCGWWGPTSKALAIVEIEGGTNRYYVAVGSGEVDVHVVNGATGKYLRTDPDHTDRNNLDDLPDC
jgi:Protein of unknown function (DUF3892)